MKAVFSALVFFLSLSQLRAQSLLPDSDRRSYQAVVDFLKAVVQNNSDRAAMIDIGESDSGKKIVGIKIGNGDVHDLVVATHHGNEYGSTEVALAFARHLAEDPIPGITMYVVPVLNISGYESGNRYENSFDPNRDYPGPCGGEGPWNLKSTQALNRLIQEKNIIASATLHTYWPAVTYPLGLSTDHYSTDYDAQFIRLANDATYLSNYTTGFASEVIYPADGTFEDFAFVEYGIWSLLFELGGSHFPNQSAINEMIRVNVPGLRKMFENAPTTRAENHAFSGNCVKNVFDPHIE